MSADTFFQCLFCFRRDGRKERLLAGAPFLGWVFFFFLFFWGGGGVVFFFGFGGVFFFFFFSFLDRRRKESDSRGKRKAFLEWVSPFLFF